MTGFHFTIISCLSFIEIVAKNDVKTQEVFLQNCRYKNSILVYIYNGWLHNQI